MLETSVGKQPERDPFESDEVKEVVIVMPPIDVPEVAAHSSELSSERGGWQRAMRHARLLQGEK